MDVLFDDIFKTQSYPEGNAADSTLLPGIAATLPYPEFKGFPETQISRIKESDPKKNKTLTYPSFSGNKKRTSSHQLGIGDRLELNSIKYEITGMISDEGRTGEAIIYKVKNEQGSVYALKLYYEFEDEHLEPNADTLQRIREISGKDILHLFDFGTGPNKYKGKFCFEVSDFAAGGDLLQVKNHKQKYSAEFIRNVVIAGIHRGLKALHSERIFHCDLKPQNVFYIDKEQTHVVIGDYGSAKSFDKTSDKELSHTTITKGTEFYLAPEQAFGIVSEKNDYYSLGMIVLHLLYPENATRINLRRIFERRTKGVRIIDFDDKYNLLNKLIEGLTLQDYNNRWGEEEISNWLSGQDVEVNYSATGYSNNIIIGNTTLHNSKDVLAYIEAGSPFYEELIEDKEGYRVLLTWVSQLQGDENRRLFDKMISHYKKYYGIDYVREAILFYFSPLRTINIGLIPYDFNTVADLKNNIGRFIACLDQLWKLTDFATLRLYFYRFEFAVRQLRVKSSESVKQIIDETFGTIATLIGTDYTPDFTELQARIYTSLRNEHLIDIFYAFNPDRKFCDLTQKIYNSLFDVCTYFETHQRNYDDTFMLLERKGFLHKISKENLTEFIRQSDNCISFLFKRKDDLDLMVNVLHTHLSQHYSTEFLYKLLNFYQQEPIDIFRVVLLRLLDSERPINIGDAQIFLYQKGTLLTKVKDFFIALDDLWKQSAFEEVRNKFFEFEFTLLQVANSDRIAFKTMIDPVFEKISKNIKCEAGEFTTLSANFYKHLSDENIIDLFYRFIPGRTFRESKIASLNTIEEVGLYFAEDQRRYAQKIPAIELGSFLIYHNMQSFLGLNWEDFVLKVFRGYTTIKVKVKNIIFDEPSVGEATVEYDYTISATEYFKSKGIDKGFEIKPAEVDSVVIKKGQFTQNESLYERFATQVLYRHRIIGKNLVGESEVSFQNALETKKQFEYLHAFTFIPRYLLYLFPIFGMLFFCANYLVDYSAFKNIGYSISPALNLVTIRIARSYYSIVLFAGYALNFFVGISLLVPILSLRKDGVIFKDFFEYHGALINRIIQFFLFGPVVFVGVYFLIDQVISEFFIFGKKAGIVLSSEKFAIFLYIIFISRQLLRIVWAFFQTYKKFRLLPLLISILIYIVFGYFSIAYENIRHAGLNNGDQGKLKVEKSHEVNSIKSTLFWINKD